MAAPANCRNVRRFIVKPSTTNHKPQPQTTNYFGTVLRSRALGRPCDAVACVAARTMASAMTSAASAPIVPSLAFPVQVPVASEKIVSPSAGVWMGEIARA